MPTVINEKDALKLIFDADINRSIGDHDLNAESSRSHTVFSFYMTARSRGEMNKLGIAAKLHLVDLAGSERISKTNVEGQMVKEATHINKSLSFLEQVVVALTDQARSHIPFRQSKLTHFLKDSLGGNSRTYMMACIWPSAEHKTQTISTLRFAARMMNIKTKPVINKEKSYMTEKAKLYLNQIKEMKEELALHDKLAGRGKVQYGPLTSAQKIQVNSSVTNYLIDDQNKIELVNVAQIRHILGIMRNVIVDTIGNDSQLIQAVIARNASATTLVSRAPTYLGSQLDDDDTYLAGLETDNGSVVSERESVSQLQPINMRTPRLRSSEKSPRPRPRPRSNNKKSQHHQENKREKKDLLLL